MDLLGQGKKEGKSITQRFLIHSVLFLVIVVHTYLQSLFLQGEDPVHPDRGNTWAGAFIQ